ncbi:hypothetical protein C1H46_009635 [Malus baccata]|uniref:Uncharacterized protein n=1 Tax=Malus baccata TaxID=106549 RepID=A0A540N152_MALBA|nr:hypothetical protein C1H46_009635 [Malus baccata]
MRLRGYVKYPTLGLNRVMAYVCHLGRVGSEGGKWIWYPIPNCSPPIRVHGGVGSQLRRKDDKKLKDRKQ